MDVDRRTLLESVGAVVIGPSILEGERDVFPIESTEDFVGVLEEYADLRSNQSLTEDEAKEAVRIWVENLEEDWEERMGESLYPIHRETLEIENDRLPIE